MEKIKDFLLYAGADPEMYKKCLPEIRKMNRARLNVFLIVSVCFLLTMLLLSLKIELLRPNCLMYGAGLVMCILLMALDTLWVSRPEWVTDMIITLFLSVLYMVGIYLGTAATTPGREAVTHVAFILTLPVLFVHPPLSKILVTFLFNVIFSICAAQCKIPEVLALDLINSWLFSIVSILVSSYIMVGLVDGFVSREKIRTIAENDLNTSLKSRNAYENSLELYPQRCSMNLSCVYVDVNGLHELNNSKGHEEGDRMLRVVARLFRDEFGPETSYRVGGDEYLAFVLDTPESEVREKAQHFMKSVQSKGYSVAIGTSTHSAGGIQIEELVKSAERRMYRAKEEHYRLMGRETR